MRVWASRLLLVIAALASVATSRKKWRLEASVPSSMPVETSAVGSDALFVTVEASAPPEVHCYFGNADRRNGRLLPLSGPTANVSTYLCPPGGKLAEVTLTGPVAGGCNSDDKPPQAQFVRVTKTEVVRVWRASTEATFDVSSNEPSVPFTVVSPHPAQIEVLDGTDHAADISILGGGNNFSIYLYAPTGSDRRVAKVRVRATVFGICGSSCAQPADEVLKIESKP